MEDPSPQPAAKAMKKTRSAPDVLRRLREKHGTTRKAPGRRPRRGKPRSAALRDVWVVVRYARSTGYRATHLVRTRKAAIDLASAARAGAEYSASVAVPVTEGDALAYGVPYYITARDARGADSDWRVASAWADEAAARRRAARPEAEGSTISTTHTYVGGPLELARPPPEPAKKEVPLIGQ